VQANGVYVARNVGVTMVRSVHRLLDAELVYRPRGTPRRDTLALVGWGLKGKYAQTAALALRLGLRYLAVEDGFLRSVRLGNVDPPLSLVFDDVGVYYDARTPSILERQIGTPHTAAERQRGGALAAAWRAGRVSKYNHVREVAPPVQGPYTLVVDQTFGDMSIELGLASPTSFMRMLEAALDEHPGLPVLLKVHPDVIAGRKRAHFEALPAGAASRVTLLATDAHAPGLIEPAHAVYVVTSQMGFEALIWQRPVRTFGMPFYAGWGLTADELQAPARRHTPHTVTLEDLVHAALIEYPRYLDPETLQRCEAERLIEWMSLQRRLRERFPPRIQAIAFSEWKQPVAQAFMAGSTLRFSPVLQTPVDPDEGVLVWGRGQPAPVPTVAPAPAAGTAPQSAPELHAEDGFLRSVGLGAGRVPPVSWVIDRRGIYYDATAPSDLEHLLETSDFPPALLERARALRLAIVEAGITKYNVGSGVWTRPAGRRPVVLVPGQVESDASIRHGAPGIRSNLALLQAVREARPDAFIVYKPHPDVLAGKRTGDEGEAQARAWCDQIVTSTPIHRLYEQVDEVQTLTSLAGFEALLRGLPVVCHGCPFYSGWGLTTDHHDTPRRTRRLSLDQLVAGALLLYPTYVSRVTGAFTTAERALWELAHWESAAPPVEPWRQRLLRRLLRRLKRWRNPQPRR
jgi:capsular polysaccharide export protein